MTSFIVFTLARVTIFYRRFFNCSFRATPLFSFVRRWCSTSPAEVFRFVRHIHPLSDRLVNQYRREYLAEPTDRGFVLRTRLLPTSLECLLHILRLHIRICPPQFLGHRNERAVLLGHLPSQNRSGFVIGLLLFCHVYCLLVLVVHTISQNGVEVQRE